MKTKILIPHSRECLGRRLKANPRWFLNSEREWRDTIGRKNGTSTRWFVAVCTFTDCPARAIVRANDIEFSIPISPPREVKKGGGCGGD